MSNCVSTHIYMGVILTEEGDEPEFLKDYEGEFSNWVIAQMATKELLYQWDHYDELTGKEKNDMWKARSALKESCPVDMIAYNHWDQPCYALVIRDFEVGTTWGHRKFSTEDLYVPMDKVQEATVWCEKHGLSFENPSLFVVGYYG